MLEKAYFLKVIYASTKTLKSVVGFLLNEDLSKIRES